MLIWIKKFSRLAILSVLTLTIFGSATSALANKPLYMWQIKSDTATLSLVGSVHVGKPDFYPLPEPMENAFNAADVLAVELDLTDPQTIQQSATIMLQQGMLPGDETLQGNLAPDIWERLSKFTLDRGVPLAMFNKFKPAILVVVLTMQEYQAQGFNAELGIDKHFLDVAQEQDKEIRALETVAAQMGLFLGVSDLLDDILLAEFMDNAGSMALETERMIALWQDGDAEGLDNMVLEQLGNDPQMSEFTAGLLDDRNRAMADKINTWLDQDLDVFIVIGAAHFGGEQGILKLLADKGRSVEQVYQK